MNDGPARNAFNIRLLDCLQGGEPSIALLVVL